MENNELPRCFRCRPQADCRPQAGRLSLRGKGALNTEEGQVDLLQEGAQLHCLLSARASERGRRPLEDGAELCEVIWKGSGVCEYCAYSFRDKYYSVNSC